MREKLGVCESCGVIIFDGDPHTISVEGCWLCVNHSPMLSDIIRQHEDILASGNVPCDIADSPEELRADLAVMRADLATNGDRNLASS